MRPSELLGVSDIYVAYDVDTALSSFGTFIESKLDEVQLTPNEQGASNSGDITRRKRARLMRDIMEHNMLFPELMGDSDKQMNSKSLRAFFGMAQQTVGGRVGGAAAST